MKQNLMLGDFELTEMLQYSYLQQYKKDHKEMKLC